MDYLVEPDNDDKRDTPKQKPQLAIQCRAFLNVLPNKWTARMVGILTGYRKDKIVSQGPNPAAAVYFIRTRTRDTRLVRMLLPNLTNPKSYAFGAAL
jgi:hypothetical protein